MDEYKVATEAPLVIGPIVPPPQFAQLGILVMDGSGSMTEIAEQGGNIQKAQATNSAVRELFTRFKVSRVARNFAFAIITFDDKPDLRMKPVQVDKDLDDNGDYNPLIGHGQGTNIFAALEKAENIANEFIAKAPAGGVRHSVVILVMSDGCCSNPARTRAVADHIKQGPNGSLITICCAFFGSINQQDDEGIKLLKSIASDPILNYKTVYNGATLRDFFERSMSAASGGIQIS